VAVSAFEPFGGRAVNRSLQVLGKLAQLRPLATHVLPVDFAALPGAVREVTASQPLLWVMLGESALASGLRVERQARNRIEARIPDNRGAQPLGAKVGRGAARRRTALDVEALVAASCAAGMPAEASDDAGAFACNAAYFLALASRSPVVFVHLPTAAQHGSVARLARGVAAIVDRACLPPQGAAGGRRR
jgi:pyroglutamyl-peptidase